MGKIRENPVKPNKSKKSAKRSKPIKAKKSPKKKNKSSNLSGEDNFQIVPWSSIDEWNQVCLSFHEKNYKQVISEILIWQQRVPSLPVGVEATLYILEAICYDELRFSKTFKHSDDQARSLYCLALVRYLNHVGHFAVYSMGEKSTIPTRDLASYVGTPDWLVTLRNEVSHGTTTPSTEILRVAGDFIVDWLKEKYWKHPDSTPLDSDVNDYLKTSNGSQELDTLMSQTLSAFIAARIYKFRDVHVIEDREITKHLPDQPIKAKTKSVVINLKQRLADFLNNKPSIMCPVIAQEMIPSSDFYTDFKTLFGNNSDPFHQLGLIWTPIVNLLERKGKVLSVCLYLGEIHVNPENESNWELSARWIDKLLQMLESSGKSYSLKLQNLLRTVMINPNLYTNIFLERLLRMVQTKLGEEKVRKLETLASIWINGAGSESSKTSKRSAALKEGDYFTINHVESLDANHLPQNLTDVPGSWTLDCRDAEKFWCKIPLGTTFRSN